MTYLYPENQYKEQQNALYTAQQLADLGLRTADIKNFMSVQKAQALSGISESSSAQKAMDAADIAAQKELQKTVISFSTNNDVILLKECFGENMKGRLSIKILRKILFCHESDDARKVLYLQIKKDNGEEKIMFWDVEKNETRWIRRIFESNGISFGFNEKKENEIRRKVLNAAINVAETMVLPEQHGWYRLNDEWKYAFPDELTWEEVESRC